MLEGRSRHPLQPHRAASQRLIGHIAAPSKHPPLLWDHPPEGLRNVMGDRVHIERLAGCMLQEKITSSSKSLPGTHDCAPWFMMRLTAAMTSFGSAQPPLAISFRAKASTLSGWPPMPHSPGCPTGAGESRIIKFGGRPDNAAMAQGPRHEYV